MSRYQFIAAHQQAYPIRRMCTVLAVSASGYYAWRQRAPSLRQQANAALRERIRAVHERSRQTYGYPRIHAELQAAGERVGKHRVARLMRQMGLRPRHRCRFHVTTRVNPKRPAAPNILAQDFSASRPNQKWLVDLTYIATREGWLYLAGVLDTFSRRIVGWSMGAHPSSDLVCDALKMAFGRRGVPALHHSDRGSQYTSHAYLKLLTEAQVQLSMSGIGHCYDNAMKESFWGTLKTECADQPFPTRSAARRAIFEYIEIWYNRQRRHSALGYLSPCAFEQLASL